MFKKHMTPNAHDLLPWYLNHTLPPAKQQAAEQQARRSPEMLNAWQAVRSAALGQPTRLPSPAVRQRLLAQARATARTSPAPRWLPALSGVILAVLMLLLLWNAVQPGIDLQWSVRGAVPTAFRVYRAPAGSERFEFVREIRAQSGTLDYRYVDTALWPGQTYQYRVEAVNAESASATIAANCADLLPAQLAIILSSLLIGLAGAYVLQEIITLPGPVHWKAV